MGLRLMGFFSCECGKMHTQGGIYPKSMCKCGRDLWKQVWK